MDRAAVGRICWQLAKDRAAVGRIWRQFELKTCTTISMTSLLNVVEGSIGSSNFQHRRTLELVLLKIHASSQIKSRR